MNLIEDLVLRFDKASCELNFHGRELKITVNDGVWTLGLPYGGSKVEGCIGYTSGLNNVT